MGKWLNGAREVRAAMDAAGAQIAGQVPVATAEERIAVLEEALNMLLSGATE